MWHPYTNSNTNNLTWTLNKAVSFIFNQYRMDVSATLLSGKVVILPLQTKLLINRLTFSFKLKIAVLPHTRINMFRSCLGVPEEDTTRYN